MESAIHTEMSEGSKLWLMGFKSGKFITYLPIDILGWDLDVAGFAVDTTVKKM